MQLWSSRAPGATGIRQSRQQPVPFHAPRHYGPGRYRWRHNESSAVSTTDDPVAAPEIDGELMERIQEAQLKAGAAAEIYGIPSAEWLELQGPVRYMGNEFGAVHKPWDSASVRFSLTYPEIYEVGSSNLGHIILYTVLNQTQGLLCDRAYFPGADLVQLLAKHNKPLFAVESKRPLVDFDILGFSLAYELGGTNILQMLKLAGIPISWEERQQPGQPWDVAAGSYPLIFAGGPTATSNPEPFADFFDFFALGDGEDLLVEIGECLKQCKAEGLDRVETLFRLATSVDGVYVPQFYQSIEGFGGAVFPIREGVPDRVKRRVSTPDPFQQIGLVPFVKTVHDRMTVEIRRGCTRGCRFCQPGMLTRPARDVEPDKVVEAVADGLRKTGYNEFSLLSLSCSDYLALPSVGLQIKNRLGNEQVSLSLPSQRVDRFDENIAAIIGAGSRKSGLTFAPEAGSQRLRDIINKGLTNEELLRGVKTAWQQGWKQIKLYFMIGLPGETDEDVMGIVDTIQWIQRECRDGKWFMAVHVTISNFTPKPHTPFQWHSVSTAEFERKRAMLREAFSGMYQVKVNYTSTVISAMEDFIGRGDRRIAKVIRRAWELGALNDAWWEGEAQAAATWNQAITDSGLSWKYRQVDSGEWNVLEALGDERYRKQGGVGKGRIDRGELADARLDMPLPWDHIDTGITKFWLKTDLQKALEAATVPDCSHSGLCSECGVCGEDMGENVVYEPPPIPKFEGIKRPDTTRAQRLRFKRDMVFVGHLDLMRLLDRALRRAALPVASDASPFHARPQIFTAVALPLGATSNCEYLEAFLTREVKPEQALQALQAQLPAGLQLLAVEACEVKKLDGSLSETMFKLMQTVEYHILVRQVAHEETGELPAVELRAAVSGVRDMASFIHSRTTKNSRKRSEDIRAQLLQVEACSRPFDTPLAQAAPAVLGTVALEATSAGAAWGVVRYVSGKKEDNNVLPAERVVDMLNVASGCRFQLVHIHRSAIALDPPAKPKMNFDQELNLRNFTKWEALLACRKQFGMGPWSGGLENRSPDVNARV